MRVLKRRACFLPSFLAPWLESSLPSSGGGIEVRKKMGGGKAIRKLQIRSPPSLPAAEFLICGTAVNFLI